jgi:hypothetical protein
MLSKFLPVGLLICALLFSCGRNGEVADTHPDPIGIPSNYEEGNQFPENKLPEQLREWIRFYGTLDSSFVLDSFYASGVALHFGPLAEATAGDFTLKKPFYPLMAFSPDSSMAIDGYSYNHLFETDNQGITSITGGEADQEVSIIQTKTGIAKQIMFNGPGLIMEAAGWIDQTAFMLATVETDAVAARFRPEILLFNLQDSTFTNFRCNKDFPDTMVTGTKGNFEQAWFQKRNVIWK